MIQAIRICFILFSLSFLITGCLETRTSQKELEEKQVLQRQVHTLQTTTAEVTQRFNEIDEDIRKLNGRVETVEMRHEKLANSNDRESHGQDQKTREMDERLKLYQQAITKLDMQYTELLAQVEVLKSERRSGGSRANESSGGGKETPGTLLEEANKHFEQKKWQEAALAFEKYRKASPKGKSQPTATLRIGICFQELGSNDDARAFFEEVIAKYPKSPDAKKAKSRLATLKK